MTETVEAPTAITASCRYCDQPISKTEGDYWFRHTATDITCCDEAHGRDGVMAAAPYAPDENRSSFKPFLSAEQVKRIEREFKVPVDGLWCSGHWHASLADESLMPADIELRQIRAFIEFKVRAWFNEGWANRILDEMPLPADAGANSLVFIKGINGEETGWHYRHQSWEMGPAVWPHPTWSEFRPYGLVELMDKEVGSFRAKEWAAFKAERPELFSA